MLILEGLMKILILAVFSLFMSNVVFAAVKCEKLFQINEKKINEVVKISAKETKQFYEILLKDAKDNTPDAFFKIYQDLILSGFFKKNVFSLENKFEIYRRFIHKNFENFDTAIKLYENFTFDNPQYERIKNDEFHRAVSNKIRFTGYNTGAPPSKELKEFQQSLVSFFRRQGLKNQAHFEDFESRHYIVKNILDHVHFGFFSPIVAEFSTIELKNFLYIVRKVSTESEFRNIINSKDILKRLEDSDFYEIDKEYFFKLKYYSDIRQLGILKNKAKKSGIDDQVIQFIEVHFDKKDQLVIFSTLPLLKTKVLQQHFVKNYQLTSKLLSIDYLDLHIRNGFYVFTEFTSNRSENYQESLDSLFKISQKTDESSIFANKIYEHFYNQKIEGPFNLKEEVLRVKSEALKFDFNVSKLKNMSYEDRLKIISELVDLENKGIVIPVSASEAVIVEMIPYLKALEPKLVKMIHLESLNSFWEIFSSFNWKIQAHVSSNFKKLNNIFEMSQQEIIVNWLLNTIAGRQNLFQKSENSIEFLKKLYAVNINANDFQSMSEMTKNYFLNLIKRLSDNSSKLEIFKRIDAELYSKENIKKTLELIQFYSLIELESDTKVRIKSQLVKTRISLHNRDAELEKYRAQLLKEFKEIISDENFKISEKHMSELIDKWGDLEVLFVLSSRLENKEVDVLREIIKQELSGKFHEYKFSGRTAEEKSLSKKQMSMLTPADQIVWETPIAKVAFPKANQAEIQPLREKIEILKNIFLHEVERSGYKVDNKITQIRNQWISRIISYKGNPNEFFKVQNVPEIIDQVKILFYAVDELMNSKNGQFEYKQLLSIVRWNLHNGVKFQNEEVNAALLTQLKDIHESIQKLNSDSNRLILSVKSSDPKLLLTIGDCVNAASCQNFREGTVIRTLPGYVIDANVQALLSFELNSSTFDSVQDFSKVKNWVKNSGVKLKVKFDGNLKVVTFTFENEVITSRQLDKGYLRNMIKLGKMDKSKKAGIAIESGYSQTHPDIEFMISQHIEIVKEMIEKISGSTKGQMTVYKSKNPAGHYSDLGSGIETDNYTLQFNLDHVRMK
ncbi:MAG: hypothetical protein A2622_09605 [Bdellovibrionales bacterium RIFCSPHIGHO2_01_FULL_40_29]|nr:MAG: hypothetical protein A2622_09605 [Bdellovibrionales bacterium RIFCSPHIGHO2_01_FULL_40_29]OFZ33523.1 MAG: hypothetical protein A3D17_00015 [Bdellovibrionales bacterium RIFCSPHIGHO2_02_FULL_40_15]